MIPLSMAMMPLDQDGRSFLLPLRLRMALDARLNQVEE
jgi:hypothetical protein